MNLLRVICECQRIRLLLEIFIVQMFFFKSLFISFFYLPSLYFFNDNTTIWIYLDFVYLNSVTESIFTGYRFSKVLFNLSISFIIIQLFTNFLKFNFMHNSIPLGLIINCKINLNQVLVYI